MANQIKAPINYPIIAGGKIVSGGSVIFGQPNVKPDPDNPSTLKAIYLDAALTQQAENPQGISSDGVFDQSDTGILYGPSDTVYSIVILGANKKQLSYIPEYDLSDANAAATAQAAAAQAESAASNAIAAKDLSEALYTDFTNRYFGAYSSNPSVDDLGNPPSEGSIYFNTVSDVFFTWDGSAWVNYFPSNPNGLMVTATGTAAPRSLADRWADMVNAKDFGVMADGVTDDSLAMNAFITHLKSNGLNGRLPAGTIVAKNLRLESGTLPWSMYGAGKYTTKIISPDGEGTTIIGTAGSSVGYSIGGFTLDCNRTGGGASPNHGISIADTSNVLFERIHVINYANSAILSYEDSAPYSDVTYSDCSCDGGDFAGNGFLIEKCLRPRIINCDAKNILATGGNGPAYGLQFKNDCVGGLISGGSATRCVAGVAFGFELGGVGVKDSIVSDVVVKDCNNGSLIKGLNNRISLTIDMGSSGESAIDVQDGSKYNYFNATVLNVAASKGAIRFRENTEDNSANLNVHGIVLNSSKYVISDTSTLRNSVNVRSYTAADIPTNGYRSLTDFSGTTNSLKIEGITPLHSFLPISSGNVTFDNAAYKVLKIDTEGGNPVTNLNNIFGSPSDGDSILITPVNDARTINVTNAGNIVTLTGADTPLDTQYKIMKLMWRDGPDRWVEH